MFFIYVTGYSRIDMCNMQEDQKARAPHETIVTDLSVTTTKIAKQSGLCISTCPIRSNTKPETVSNPQGLARVQVCRPRVLLQVLACKRVCASNFSSATLLRNLSVQSLCAQLLRVCFQKAASRNPVLIYPVHLLRSLGNLHKFAKNMSDPFLARLV